MQPKQGGSPADDGNPPGPGKCRKRRGNKGRKPDESPQPKAPDDSGKSEKARKEHEKKMREKGIKCVKCGGSHWSRKCKTPKIDCEKWQASEAGKALSEKLKKERAKKSSDPGGGDKSSNPGGKKKALKTVTSGKSAEKANKDEAAQLGADGVTSINGVPGWYSCDGVCDKSTIGSVYADALRKQGTDINRYATPLNATLIDGSTGPSVTHYLVVDVVLTTNKGWRGSPSTNPY